MAPGKKKLILVAGVIVLLVVAGTLVLRQVPSTVSAPLFVLVVILEVIIAPLPGGPLKGRELGDQLVCRLP